MPEGSGKRLSELLEQMPHATLLDVDALLARAKDIAGQASGAASLLAVLLMGSALLVLGIFLLFYVSHRRVWAMVMPREDGGTDLLMAGTNQRRPEEFETEFGELADAVENQLGVAGDMPGRRRKNPADSTARTEQTD